MTTEKIHTENRNKKDILILRLLIIIGLITMVIFFVWLFQPKHYGGTALYYLLISIMIFSALKTVAEWYHYFNIKSPLPPKNQKKFTVDIFTTYCPGEPIEMIEETLLAIKAIRYPHESYLCDESDSPHLKEFCIKHGIHHVTRSNRIDAKAGNINNALRQSDGEICVILDPDHVPQHNFLDDIIPYFSNPKIGFVQIVQAYKNIRDSIISRGAAQQTFQFYGPMMMSMNAYGTVLAIGANCTFRRKALDSIGGHAPGLAEDMHTAMKLHAKGWKSVYIPKILARGLVPSSLDAYYKQQLKWSRGVFELLFTTFPHLFKNFTWRQKLHYGTLPFHYFSGVIYLLNFLIPILSLLLAVIPLKVDLIEFFFIGAPFLANTLIIRHYVQKWVMEETERGFHLIGGILQIGTWWVHSLGFIYAILRKKVPYIPTPKDGEEGNNFLLNLPNIIVILISIFSIIYGISIDYNPFTFVMAGLAGVNCLFMVFMLIAGKQSKITAFKIKYNTENITKGIISKLRLLFWNVKHDIYALIRKIALPVSLFLTVFSFTYVNKTDDYFHNNEVIKKGKFYTGIFSPELNNGLTTIKAVNKEENSFDTNFDLVSCYIPWGDKSQFNFPSELINAIIQNNKYPFITWEPWVSTFKISGQNEHLKDEKRGLESISKGMFDNYLKAFANQIKGLEKPIFIRFAHEPDNPAYPWSKTGENSPEDFIRCWRYVHQKFDSLNVDNVIWVWNPWKSKNLKEYFPGEEYVDWIGVTGLNYGVYNHDRRWYNFDEYYTPFSQDSVFQHDIPVIIAEFGSVTLGGDQTRWFKDAFESIEEDFPEIKGVVFFNSNLDENMPDHLEDEGKINWHVNEPGEIINFQKSTIKSSPITNSTEPYPINHLKSPTRTLPHNKNSEFFENIKGVNYRKGNMWFRNFYALNMREVKEDFEKIKSLGAKTLKWSGPGIYDRNVLAAAKQSRLDIHYSFWIPNEIDFINDTKKLEDLSDKVLTTIKNLKGNPSIVAWNIGNDAWYNINNHYYKPDVFLQRAAYLGWLEKIVDQISEIDNRPISIDINASKDLRCKIKTIHNQVPKISGYGLIYDSKNEIIIDDDIQVTLFNSDIPPVSYLDGASVESGFISSFQDLGTPNYISFTGLINHEGKPKDQFFRLQKKWNNTIRIENFENFRILKQAYPLKVGRPMSYMVVKQNDHSWSVIENDPNSTFKWHLIRTDEYGNGIYKSYIGDGPKINFVPPEDYKNYELLLTVDKGKYVIQTRTKLFTPLKGSDS